MSYSEPRILAKSNIQTEKKKKYLFEWPKGNLKCNWDMIIMPHDDYIIELNKRKKIGYIVPLVLIFISFFIGFLALIIKGFTGLLISFFFIPIFILLGAFIFFILKYAMKKAMDPNERKEIKVGWGKVSREQAITSVKNHLEKTYPNYHIEMNTKIKKMGWNYPEEQYYLPNGIVIKTAYRKIEGNPAGWISIEYLPYQWDIALETQLELDNYLYEKKIANIRN